MQEWPPAARSAPSCTRPMTGSRQAGSGFSSSPFHIHVRALDELRCGYVEKRHDAARDGFPALNSFVLAKHDFQLHERAERFHFIEVDPGAIGHVKAPCFSHATHRPECTQKGLSQRVRRGDRGDQIVARFRTHVVGAQVVDQLAVAVGELAQFQPAVRTGEESIVLHQVDRTLGREGARALLYPGEVADARLDLDVPRHAFSRRFATARSQLDEIPQIAVEVLEDGDDAVGLDLALPRERDAPGLELAIVALEIIGVEEKEDAPARLVSDPRFLLGADGAGQEKPRLRPRRRHDDPALALLRDGRVLDKGEADNPDVESDRFVVIANQERHKAEGLLHQRNSRETLEPSWMARIASAKSGATDLTWILRLRLPSVSGMVSVTSSWRSGEASMRSTALPDSTACTTHASTATAPRSSTKRAASTSVPPLATSSSTISATFPLTSPMRFTARAVSSSPWRRLSTMAIGRSRRVA